MYPPLLFILTGRSRLLLQIVLLPNLYMILVSRPAGRSFYLCCIGVSASELLSDLVKSGGGGGGGLWRSKVLCIMYRHVWATICLVYSVVYLGHRYSYIYGAARCHMTRHVIVSCGGKISSLYSRRTTWLIR